jgi:hypothetical protein
MLVLALQFSKGCERGRMRNDYLTRQPPAREPAAGVIGRVGRAGHTEGRGSASSVPSPRSEDPIWVDSLKTEEKTKFIEPACQEDESCD